MSSSRHVTCADVRTLLGGYVLHALEPGEADTVHRHLGACPACAAEYHDLQGVPALLDLAGAVETPAEQPPPALEEAVLDRFAREHPSRRQGDELAAKRDRRARAARLWPRRLTRPLPAALAGAVAAAAVTAALVVLPGGGSAGQGEHYQASLSGSPAAPGATAKANLVVLSSGTRVKLSVRGLHGSPDSVYELWCLRDDGARVSAGTFRVDGAGNADLSLTTAATPDQYHRLAVERRPSGTDSPARGQRVLAGEIAS